MSYVPHPEFRKLYSLFTPDEGSIGERLNGLQARLASDEPLLVATGTDVVVFPGKDRPPIAESFRMGTRGFIDLVSYSCDVTSEFLQHGLESPDDFTFERLRTQYLDPVDSVEVPVPINDMMVGTFGLVFLDIGYRIMRWLRAQDFDWERMMVVISVRAGRTTAGVTWQTNNMCHLLWRASHQRLPAERVYIAPHAPSLVLEELRSDSGRAALESRYRQIWFSTRVSVEVGREMFAGYPAFRPPFHVAPTLDEHTDALGELPALRSLGDRRALVTRLRFVMEDPAQQLSNAVAHYILDQMDEDPIDPGAVFVPGFTDVPYPKSRA